MTVEEIPTCPIGSRKHQAATEDGRPTGHPLCEKHFKRLSDVLRKIESEYGNLSAAPSIAIHWNTSGGGGSGGAPAFEQAAALLAPLVLTDTRPCKGNSEDAVERHASGRIEPAIVVLSDYANRVREERGFKPPSVTFTDCVDRLAGTPRHGPAYGLPCRHHACRGITWEHEVLLPLTVKTERALLTRQLDWIVRWPDIDVVFTRIRRLLAHLKAANGTVPQPFGKCPVDKDPGKTCGGPLWPTKPKHTSGEQVWRGSTPSAVRCDSCGTRWEGPGELAVLALMLDSQQRAKAS